MFAFKTLMSNKMYYIAVGFAFGLRYMATAQHHCRPKDCYDLRCYGLSEGQDGPHIIYPDTPNLPSLEVACDQEAHGGGWIMYQRRVDGTLNFTRTWENYTHGFGTNGDTTTELWLGNENVYQLLQSFENNVVDLRIEVDAFDGEHGWIECSSFTMQRSQYLYRINWVTSTASKIKMAQQWDEHKGGYSFKTFDKVGSSALCLKLLKGGWWYNRVCGQVFLNGEYIKLAKRAATSIYIQGFSPLSLKRSRMMFRMTNVNNQSCDNPCSNGATCEHVVDPRGHRCVCKFEFCGPECKLANPCKNGGACQYDETTNSRTCKCSGKFCGPECELKCKNGGTCEYRNTTNSTSCKCSAEFEGMTCEDAVTTPPTIPPTTPTTPTTIQPTTPSTIIMPVVGGILLLLILCGIGITAGVIYKRRRIKKQKEETEKEEEEEAEEKLKHAESGYFLNSMLSMFGF